MFLRRRLMVFLGMCLLAMSVSYCGNTKGNGAGAKCTSLDDCDQELKLECRAGKCRPAIVNRKPIAKIRLRDSNYEVGDTIELDGRSSADPDDDLLSYKWSLKEAPEGSKAKLNDAGKTLAKLRADKAGKYVFELIVSDGTLSSEAVLSTVDVDSRTNENPTANAGDDQVVAPKAKVQLNGSLSSDNDEDKLSYLWRIVTKPRDSQAKLSDASVAKPSFLADKEGKYIVELIVEDEFGGKSAPDTVSIESLQGHDKVPSLSSFTPKESNFGLKATITLIGKDFFKGAKILLESDRKRETFDTTFKSGTSLTSIFDLKSFDPGKFKIHVINPNGLRSQEKHFFVVKDLPAPKLFSIFPNRSYAGIKKIVIKAKGEFFLKGVSKVFFENTELNVRIKNSKELEFDLSLGKTEPQIYQIRIVNPGNRSSRRVPFQVLPPAPNPVLKVLNPPYGDEGKKLAFSVHGVGFNEGVQILFVGKVIPSHRENRTEVKVVPELDLKGMKPGLYDVWVRNPDGKESKKIKFRIRSKSPKPTLDRIVPFFFYLDEKLERVSVYGSSFLKGAKLFIGNNEVKGVLGKVVWKSDSYMEATVNLTDRTKWVTGDINAYVANPNGEKSGVFKVTVTHRVPSISNVTPSGWTTKCDTKIEVRGSNFIKASVVKFGSTTYKQGDKTYPLSLVNPKLLTFQLKASKLTAGTFQVWVENGSNAKSQKQNFKLDSSTSSTPYVDYIRPSIGAGGRQVLVTFQPSSKHRQSFKPGAIVYFNGKAQKTTCSLSFQKDYCYSITASLDLASVKAGVYKLYVANPCNVKSAEMSFTVEAAPAPYITGFTPAFVRLGSGKKMKVKIHGVNFPKSPTLTWDGKVIKSVYVSSKEIVTAAPVDFTKISQGNISVKLNFANGTVTPVTFLPIISPFGPTITLIGKNTQPRAGTLPSILIQGTDFLVTSQVIFDGKVVASRFVSTKSLLMTGVEVGKMKVGLYYVQVKNGKRGSNVYPFILLPPPLPRIDYMRPSSAVAGTVSKISVYLQGQRFASPTKPKILVTDPNGKDISSTYVRGRFSGTTYISGVWTVSGLGVGQYTFQIQNIPGIVSNKVVFTMTPPPPPIATSITPPTVSRGQVSQPIYVVGSNFANGDFVVFNNNILQKFPGVTVGSNLSVNLNLSGVKYSGKYPLYVVRCLDKKCIKKVKTATVYITVDDPPCGKNPAGAVKCATQVLPKNTEVCNASVAPALQVCRPKCKTTVECAAMTGAPKKAVCKSGFCQ